MASHKKKAHVAKKTQKNVRTSENSKSIPDVETPSEIESYCFSTTTHSIYVKANSLRHAVKIYKELHGSNSHGILLKLTHQLSGGKTIEYKYNWIRRIWWTLMI